MPLFFVFLIESYEINSKFFTSVDTSDSRATFFAQLNSVMFKYLVVIVKQEVYIARGQCGRKNSMVK